MLDVAIFGIIVLVLQSRRFVTFEKPAKMQYRGLNGIGLVMGVNDRGLSC